MLRIFLCAVFLSFVFVHAAAAESAFFVQLGTASSESDAEEKWERLKEEYPDLLSKLELRNHDIAAGLNQTEYRIQAGPTGSRDIADRICTQLSLRSVPCFIVETALLEGTPTPTQTAATTLANITPAAEMVPEAKAEFVPEPVTLQPPAAAPETTEATPIPPSKPEPTAPVVLPWLVQGETPAGKVEVSEAVPVLPVGPDEDMPTSLTSESFDGWLRIKGFASEQTAYDFYQMLSQRFGVAIGERVRITRPFLSSRNGAMLALGSIKERVVADAICQLAAQTPALTCQTQASSQESHATAAIAPGSITTTALPMPHIRVAGTQNLRKRQAYWAQLGSWPNKAKAMDYFERIQPQHTALKGQQPHFSEPPARSLNAERSVRLRLGPFSNRPLAEQLCTQLETTPSGCLVIAE